LEAAGIELHVLKLEQSHHPALVGRPRFHADDISRILFERRAGRLGVAALDFAAAY
jgi:hypothetical protein